MKKFNFALFSDAFFFILCTFLVTFTAIRFYVRRAVTALIIAIGVSLCAGVLIFFLLYKKRKKRLVLSLGDSERKSLSLHLSVCGKNYINDLFLKALDGTYMAGNRLESDEEAYFFNFKMSPLSSDDIAEIIRESCEKKKHVYCSAISPDALSLAQDFSIEVTGVSEIYALLKDKNLLPEKYALGEVKKPTLPQIIKRRFNRRLCPSLFFCGLSLLFFSFFTRFYVYYIVFGAILMALSAASLLFGQRN